MLRYFSEAGRVSKIGKGLLISGLSNTFTARRVICGKDLLKEKEVRNRHLSMRQNEAITTMNSLLEIGDCECGENRIHPSSL